jgi:hypothetical protein
MSKEFLPGVLSLIYPTTPFILGGFFFLQDEFISRGENDMKRNKRSSREIVVRRRFLGGEKRIWAHLRRVEDGEMEDERWKRKEEEKDDEGEE